MTEITTQSHVRPELLRFIKANVVRFEYLIALGSVAKAKEHGKLRIEGKEYIVQDGDVIEFQHNA